MKKIINFLVCATVLIQLAYAANGDSTVVRVWDKFPMNQYGAYDAKALLPPATQKHQRILLKFTLGCTSNGQCEWDYDLELYARKKTGNKDSTLKQAPYLKVNNTARDSVAYSSDTTWVNVFNNTTKLTDSIPSAILKITLYADSLNNPLVITDSINGFTANYYRYSFDITGKKTDSVWISATNTIHQHNTPYYSVFDAYENFELGRFISPYAKAFPKTFQYDYVYDVTDFAKLLSDSADLRIFFSGYSFGFTATWDLIYIEGVPAKEVVDVVNIYDAGYTYGGTPSIETSLSEKTFTVPAGTASVKARILISGHGGEGNENCAEFCAKNYYLLLNNQQIAQQLVWRDDCGANPITAQGGTWIYDRANWCPGELVKPFEYNLNVTAGSNNTINMNMDAFTANGYAGYKIVLQLIYYKPNTYQNDVAIDDILAPSKSVWNSKTNPICDNAKVVIKNYGALPLKDAWVSVTLGNGAPMGKMWSGNLAYGESATFTVPDLIWPADLSNTTFKAEILTLNGKNVNGKDENLSNNSLTSEFELPITVPNTFIIETRTNSVPGQNGYIITDSKGTVYKSKTFSTANTTTRDTVKLGFGCYTFKFNDDMIDGQGSNGLGWWAAPGEGTGSLRIVTPAPIKVIKTFSTDFGTFTQLNFRVQHPVDVIEQTLNANEINVYPSPANNIMFIEGANFAKGVITNLSGKQVASYTQFADGINVQELPAGMYLLTLTTADNQSITKKISIHR
jgi:hypothetical protein